MSYQGLQAELVTFEGHKGDKGEAYYARPSRAAAASRSRISKAAFSVNVQSTSSFGWALPRSSRLSARSTML